MDAAGSWRVFDDYGLHRYVLSLVAGRVHGVLAVQDGTFEKRLFFRSGNLVFATSKDPAQRLSAALVQRGVLTHEQYEQAKTHFSSAMSIGRNLLQLGLVSEGELRDSARAQVFSILTSLMVTKQGRWHLSSQLPAQPITQIPMTMPHVFIRALLEWEDRSWIGRHFQDKFSRRVSTLIWEELAGWMSEVDSLGGQLCREIASGVTLRELAFERDIEPFIILRWVYIIDLISRSLRSDLDQSVAHEPADQPPVRRRFDAGRGE